VDLHKAIDADITVTRAVLVKTVKQFTIYADRIDNLEYKYARERVVYRLLFLASRFGEKQADGSYVLTAPISQQVIASSINLSRESVSREFDRLQRHELVEFNNERCIVVKNVQHLCNELKSPVSPDWWGLL
jgi:CRP-like cAMP-binding protein